MDFEFPEFRDSSMPGGSRQPALIGKDQEFELRQIKLHEEAIKIEQAHCKLLEQHDRKLLERLNAELAEISVFIPLYPELPLQSVQNWRSPVEYITGQKRRREDGCKETELQSEKKKKIDLMKSQLKSDKIVEEEMCRVETLENEGNITGACNSVAILNGLLENLDELLNGSHETEPVKNLPTKKSKPVKDSDREELEPVKNSAKENSEPVMAKSEPVKNKSEPVKNKYEPVNNKYEPVKNKYEPGMDKSVPVRNKCEPIKKKCGPVKNKSDSMKNWAVFTLGYWHFTLCKIKTLNKEVLETHFYGKRHKLNLVSNRKLSAEKSEPVKELVIEKCEPARDSITQETEPVKSPITVKYEPVKQLVTEKIEPVKDSVTENSEPVKELVNERIEPVKEFVTEKIEPVKDSVAENSEPVKELVNERIEPVKELITEKIEPVKELITAKSEPEPETHLNKKQKLDLPNSQLIINKSEKPNEEKTTKISNNKESRKISNKTVPIRESMENYALFTKGYWHCALCKIKNPSKKVLESHFYGKRHRSNLINGSPNLKPVPHPKPVKCLTEDRSDPLNGSPNGCPDPKPAMSSTEHISNLLNGSPNGFPDPKSVKSLAEQDAEFLKSVQNVIQKLETGYLCTVCILPFVPLGSVKLHLKGKKHRKNLEKLGSRSESGPVKEFVFEPFKKSGSEPVKRSRYEPLKIYVGPAEQFKPGPVKQFGSGPIKLSGSVPVKPTDSGPVKITGPGSIKLAGSGPIKSSETGPVKTSGSGPVKTYGSGPVKPSGYGYGSGPVKVESVCVLCEFRGCNEKDLADHFWRAHQDLGSYFF